jgi:hypothetical protein
MTLSASAVSKKRLDKIESDRPEVKDSASIDLEWIPYKGKYEHTKTKIFAASLCTNWGERIALHISRYSTSPNPEKTPLIVSHLLLWLSKGLNIFIEDLSFSFFFIRMFLLGFDHI